MVKFKEKPDAGNPPVRFDEEEGASLPALLVRNLSDRLVASLCLGTVLAILFFGLWPFGYPIPNRVKVLSDAPGIRFMGGKGRAKLNAGGVVYTPEPLLDLITNVTGTIFGVIAACPFVKRKVYEMH